MNITPWLNWFWFGLKVLSKPLILRGKDKSNRNVFLLGLVTASLSLSRSFSYTCLSHVQFFYFAFTHVHFASFYLSLPLNIVVLFHLPFSVLASLHKVYWKVLQMFVLFLIMHVCELLLFALISDSCGVFSYLNHVCVISRWRIFCPCPVSHPPPTFLFWVSVVHPLAKCSFTICPLHPLLCILLCALSGLLMSPGKKEKKHVYRQWSFRCNVFITRWEQALYGAG